jgi:glycosyltransferase involved in cell wall biosynthesis
MLKILVYTDSEGIGGAEISLGHLVATASSEIQIIVAGVSKIVVNAIADRRKDCNRIVLPKNFLAHWLLFKRLQPNIIHINLCTPWACATALTAALLISNTRIVRVDQLPLRTTAAIALWRTRFLSLRVDAHVAVGEASARKMEDFYALGRNSVISIPNGVPDIEEPKPLHSKPSITVGSIGRLDAMKGHDVLLRAVAQVEHVNAVILGEGSERSNLEHLATELGIRDRVTFPGWIEEPRSWLPSFDVVAMPSRSEGFPLAMVEAMLAARPLIATRVGSMPEAVIDGKTGLLIEKNDAIALANALQLLRDDPALRIRLGQQAREMALAHFTVQAMTMKYESLWRSVMQRSSVPRAVVPRPKD